MPEDQVKDKELQELMQALQDHCAKKKYKIYAVVDMGDSTTVMVRGTAPDLGMMLACSFHKDLTIEAFVVASMKVLSMKETP